MTDYEDRRPDRPSTRARRWLLADAVTAAAVRDYLKLVGRTIKER